MRNDVVDFHLFGEKATEEEKGNGKKVMNDECVLVEVLLWTRVEGRATPIFRKFDTRAPHSTVYSLSAAMV